MASSLFTQPPVNPDDPGIGHITQGITWAFTSLAIVVVGSRLYVRRKLFFRNADEWIMALALALQIVYQICITISVRWGMGKDFVNMTLEEYIQSQKWEFIAITPAQFVSMLARVSITILLARIFGVAHLWFRWFLIAFTSLQCIVGALGIVFLFAEKLPVSTHWEPMIQPHRLLDQRVNQYTSTAFVFLNAISDITYVVFPVAFVWNIQMPTSRKVGLVTVLSMSLLTAGACIAKITVIILGLTNQLSLDVLSDFNGIVFLTSSIEQCLVMMMGCIPTMGLVSKLKLPPFLSAVGESIASLFGSGRRSSNGSNTYAEDMEAAAKFGARGSDDSEGAPRRFLGLSSAKNSNQNLNPEARLRRDDEIAATHEYQTGRR